MDRKAFCKGDIAFGEAMILENKELVERSIYQSGAIKKSSNPKFKKCDEIINQTFLKYGVDFIVKGERLDNINKISARNESIYKISILCDVRHSIIAEKFGITEANVKNILKRYKKLL